MRTNTKPATHPQVLHAQLRRMMAVATGLAKIHGVGHGNWRPGIEVGIIPYDLTVEQAYAAAERLINACTLDGGECHQCSEICCPWGEPLHFHHDGCPACAQAEENGAKVMQAWGAQLS
jgi:hypothetical protein